MKIHTGDIVLVIAGKDRGKQGRVMRILGEKNRVIVESVNMRTRHIKKTAQGPGQKIKYEAALSASNVMIIDPKTKKPTRIGYRVDAKTGKKVRVAKVSGDVLPIVSTTRAVEKKSAKKVTKDVKETEGTEEKKVQAGPTKQPFWKRAFSGSPDAEKGDNAGASTAEHAAAPVRRTSRESNG